MLGYNARMHIPTSLTIVCFLAAFVLTAFQYYRLNPERRVLNIRFLLMAGAVVLLFLDLFLGASPGASVLFFGLAVVWLAVAVYYLRLMPPPKTQRGGA
jgi:predicted membrane channel-forming protein YqfA (hemolysin III family)